MQLAVPGSDGPSKETDRDAEALRPRQPDDRSLRPHVPRRAAAGRARRALRPGLRRRRRRRRLGRAQQAEGQPLEEQRPRRQADRGAAQRPEANAGCWTTRSSCGRPSSAARPARRTPTAATTTPTASRVWLAGGGIKGGVVHGATDEIGFHAVEDRHYVTDIHATVLQQLGLDARRLEVPGHKRLEIDYGKPIDKIIA